ncbi:MAG: hypothetical protein QM533_13220 [Cytophagales bacterium]|nr:hypothetical protein [Cytophagales bacterium]
MKTTPLLSIASAVALTTLLAACGGGGGGSSSTTPTPTLYTATCANGTTRSSTVSQSDAAAQCFGDTNVYASTIVTSVPADTYNAVTQAEEKAAFNLLNQERSSCGFGKLAQNTLLDTAAQGHADWLLKNNYVGHFQVAGTPGFTGVSLADRFIAAGYSGIGNSEVSTNYAGSNSKTGKGIAGIRGLLEAPYHSIALLSGFRDIGASIRNASDAASSYSPSVTTEFTLGYTASSPYQAIASSDILTYPCQGTTGTGYRLTGEEPSPIPSRNLATSPVGHPIIVMIRKGRVLTLTSATMTKVSTGAAIPLRTPVTLANDVNQGYYEANFGYVLPDVALEPSTQYQVTINGSNGATAFTRTFTFTTGSVNY